MLQIVATPLPTLLAFALGVLIICLGCYISWRAFQGYRRNSSRRMALLAVGMLFVTVMPTVIELVLIPIVGGFFGAAGPAIEYTIIVSRVSEAVGVLVLIYSLHTGS